MSAEKKVREQYDYTKMNEKMDLDDLKQVIANSSKETAIYIGCDSKRFMKRGVKLVSYVTVVVVHLDSKHGGRLFKTIEIERDWGITMRQRLMNEVYHATNLAYELIDVIGDRHFEIHLDVNRSPNHPSNIVMREAMGYVLGMLGIEPKLKPDSFAASSAADAITVKLADVRKRDRRG